MHPNLHSDDPNVREPWYKYGVAVLLFEMMVAVAVSGYSLFMTFHGQGGFLAKH